MDLDLLQKKRIGGCNHRPYRSEVCKESDSVVLCPFVRTEQDLSIGYDREGRGVVHMKKRLRLSERE